MIRSIPLGTYVPGASMIHRTPPMVKFCTLILAIIGTSIWVKSLYPALIFLAIAVILYGIARIPPRIMWAQLWPPIPLLLFLGAFQWWQLGVGTGRRHYDRAVWFGHACRVAHAHHHH